MALNTLQRGAYRVFGSRASRSPQLEALDANLRRAHMTIRADAFLAQTWLVGMISAVTITVVALMGFVYATSVANAPLLYGVVILAVPGLGFYATYAILVGYPQHRARQRAKQIDARLPYAANYITAMASAGVIPNEIFRSLSTQEVYGEVAREAAWIYKDLEIHGKDIVTAMRRAIDRSPSEKFQDLLQGAITTVTSGGDLKAYFLAKARRLQFENRQEQQAFVETMGLMAEAYVTAAVAGPLFLIVMVAIFVLMGSAPMSVLQMLIYLLLPVINIGFMLGLKAMIPEV